MGRLVFLTLHLVAYQLAQQRRRPYIRLTAGNVARARRWRRRRYGGERRGLGGRRR